MDTTFAAVWADIQDRLAVGTSLDTWSAKGRTRSHFRIVSVSPESIEVAGPGIKGIRRVPKHDFENIHACWEDYCRDRIPRGAITNGMGIRHSSYVLGILHWREEKAGVTGR